ncbi:hypothetical protein DL93DRAFT_2228342 [Clavulina sp. PMI_390]|nr:hypothetical protein DL93DRAFT_2228342 [Clavulina sp. PMI_390]
MVWLGTGRISLQSSVGQVLATAQEQGGLLSGKDPTAFNTSDPIRLWIIQLGVIIMTTQLLALLLSKLRQPRVIAEVICGIFLGPTVMGRVPGFTEHIFPTDSRPYLNLTATIGLVFFLFLVGLEIDLRVIKRNARSSFIISIGAILLPLGIGFGMAVPIYNQFVDKSTTFGDFALFVAVAYSITAFPVLCRILTELKLLDTTIGIVVLSAGVGNDIVGWTLLALTVALVNAGSGLTALYILLVAIGWSIFILVPVKRTMLWIAHRTGSTENGPTPLMMTISIMLMFASAFFTDVIGVHAIFGAFLAGLAIPHEGGLAIALTEKLEDLTSIVFLPLYFMYSGLSTDLGLLNNGITWGYTIAIITTAYFGKMVGGLFGARGAGFTWRESATVGTLLSCKGLVELIVLNIGLAAGILSTRVFSMFVLEALALTFFTTPMTLMYYPSSSRKRVTVTGGDFSAVDGEPKPRPSNADSFDRLMLSSSKHRLTVVLDKTEHMPGLMTITRFLQAAPSPSVSRPSSPTSSSSNHDRPQSQAHVLPPPQVSIDALRLVELTERTSMLMKSAAADELLQSDSMLSTYRAFGDLHDIHVSSSLSIVSHDGFAKSVVDHASRHFSDLVVLSWVAPAARPQPAAHPKPPTTPGAEPKAAGAGPSTNSPVDTYNPFDALFRSTGTADQSSTSHPPKSSALDSRFVRRVFNEALPSVDVALFIDRSSLTGRIGTGGRQHIFLPFFGGPDDRLALASVMQLCAHEGLSATIVKMTKTEHSEVEESEGAEEEGELSEKAGEDDWKPKEELQKPAAAVTRNSAVSRTGGTRSRGHTAHNAAEVPGFPADHSLGIQETFPDSVYARQTTTTRLESETADNIAWTQHSEPRVPTRAHEQVRFVEASSPRPIRHVVEMVDAEFSDVRLIIATGRSRRLAAQSHQDEMNELLSGGGSSGLGASLNVSEVRKTVGDVAAGLLFAGAGGASSRAALVVFQAADVSL